MNGTCVRKIPALQRASERLVHPTQVPDREIVPGWPEATGKGTWFSTVKLVLLQIDTRGRKRLQA